MLESTSDKVLAVLIVVAAIAYLATLSVGDAERSPVSRVGTKWFTVPLIYAGFVAAAVVGWALSKTVL